MYCLFFSFVLFSRLLAFIKDGRASKQEFSQLSLFYTGNHYDWLFKTYATPRNLFTYRLADLLFQLTFKIIVSLSLPPDMEYNCCRVSISVFQI